MLADAEMTAAVLEQADADMAGIVHLGLWYSMPVGQGEPHEVAQFTADVIRAVEIHDRRCNCALVEGLKDVTTARIRQLVEVGEYIDQRVVAELTIPLAPGSAWSQDED